MINQVLIAVAIVAVSSAQLFPPISTSAPGEEPSVQTNYTPFVEHVLSNLRENINRTGLNNIRLPDVFLQVNHKSIYLSNGTIKGLGNIYRVGDVTSKSTLLNTKIRSAFAIYNLSTDQDVAIQGKNVSYPNGHIHSDVDNVTVYQVYKLEHAGLLLQLDEFEITVGNVNFNISGLGDQLQNDSDTTNRIIKQTKDPFFKILSFTIKILVNLALQAARSALLAG